MRTQPDTGGVRAGSNTTATWSTTWRRPRPHELRHPVIGSPIVPADRATASIMMQRRLAAVETGADKLPVFRRNVQLSTIADKLPVFRRNVQLPTSLK